MQMLDDDSDAILTCWKRRPVERARAPRFARRLRVEQGHTEPSTVPENRSCAGSRSVAAAFDEDQGEDRDCQPAPRPNA
jgi:hypothetical protein